MKQAIQYVPFLMASPILSLVVVAVEERRSQHQQALVDATVEVAPDQLKRQAAAPMEAAGLYTDSTTSNKKLGVLP